MDDVKVVSVIIYVIKHGLQWKDALREIEVMSGGLKDRRKIAMCHDRCAIYLLFAIYIAAFVILYLK